jgi:glycosyltransferase involved in cell wall biosynthesis
MRPIVTVILPNYNGADSLEQFFRSYKGLKNDDIELVILDGGSMDRSKEIIDENVNLVNVFISEKDKGIYDAMNKAIKHANGRFLYFIGGDDEFLGGFNEILPSLTNEKTIYYGNVVMKSSQSIYNGEFTLSKLINKNICHQAIFYPKEVFQQFEYSLEYPTMADYVLNLKLWASKTFKFEYVKCNIALYNDITGKSSTSTDKKFKRDAFSLVYNLFGLKGLLYKSFNPFRNLFIL